MANCHVFLFLVSWNRRVHFNAPQ